jgi:hypothetical protein
MAIHERVRYAVRFPNSEGGPGFLHSEHRSPKAARREAKALANHIGRAVTIEKDHGPRTEFETFAIVAPGPVRKRKPKGLLGLGFLGL